MVTGENGPEFQVLIRVEDEKWCWPALGAVPAALRRKYPTASIDLVASARQAELFAALPDVRQVTHTPPDPHYDIEITLGTRVTAHYDNQMLVAAAGVGRQWAGCEVHREHPSFAPDVASAQSCAI